MSVEGKFNLKASIQDTWDYLLKPGTLASCIPGCEKMEIIDDNTYETVVRQKVGPISLKLNLTTRLAELYPPRYIKAIGEGMDLGKAGSLYQETIVRLNEISEDEVEVLYESNINLVGRLASLGEKILKGKLISLGEEFTQNLQTKISG